MGGLRRWVDGRRLKGEGKVDTGEKKRYMGGGRKGIERKRAVIRERRVRQGTERNGRDGGRDR